jgi:hypothetical protein
MGLLAFIVLVILIIIYRLYMKKSNEPIRSEPQDKPQSPVIRIRIFKETYNTKTLRARPDCLFLFGDNEDKAGTRGQAVIRHEPNAVGIVTKRHPFMNEDSFYDDEDYDANASAIDESFENLRKKIEASGMEYKFIFIPKDGLGTGLAQLPQRAPKTFVYILSLLYDLISEYDPTALESDVGSWIQSQQQLAASVKRKRINV